VPADQNKLAYSGAQALSICPDEPIGTSALQGSLSDPSRSANIFFSEASEDLREPAERARDNSKKGCGYERSQEQSKAGCGSEGAL
jgi:hypothetical protein